MDALKIVHLSYRPHILCVVIRNWQYKDEKFVKIRALFCSPPFILGISMPKSIWKCQKADGSIVPSHLILFTLTCGVKPLHERKKYIPSLTVCLSL